MVMRHISEFRQFFGVADEAGWIILDVDHARRSGRAGLDLDAFLAENREALRFAEAEHAAYLAEWNSECERFREFETERAARHPTREEQEFLDESRRWNSVGGRGLGATFRASRAKTRAKPKECTMTTPYARVAALAARVAAEEEQTRDRVAALRSEIDDILRAARTPIDVHVTAELTDTGRVIVRHFDGTALEMSPRAAERLRVFLDGLGLPPVTD